MTTTAIKTREWSGLLLETRIEYGKAARRNRGNYSGQKVHRLVCEYVVGVIGPQRPGTVGAQFVRTGKPVLFSSQPCCGTTQGQTAAAPFASLTEHDVTCTKCKP